MSVFLVLCLLVVCSFAPGFFFVRRLRWSPLEKLCGSVGLSLILVYLAAWGIYIGHPPGGAAAYFVVSAICAGLGIAAWRDIRALTLCRPVRRALLGFAFLLAWTLLILAMIRCYSGAEWGGDWTEHFQRSLFFLHRFPLDSPIWGGYKIPARPPMMNVLAAFFLGQTGDQYYIFQVVFTFLNLSVFLPCCLILPMLLSRGGVRRERVKRFFPILTALFALNPAVMEASTYTWTKAFTAFYVVLGLALYLAGWRKNDRLKTTAGFVAAAAGLLAHYSAGPYCIFLGLHYLVRLFWKRPRKWLELAGIAAACGLLLGSWFGWSLAAYGPKVTFGSNTSITSVDQYKGSNWVKIAGNVFDSIVPKLLREPGSIHMFDQPNGTGFIRDNAFVFYQMNLVFALGVAGAPLGLWLLWRAFRRRGDAGGKEPPRDAAERHFWLALIPFSILVGLAVVGERNSLGSAHLTLLPLEVLGLSLIAARFPVRRAVAVALLAGCTIDFAMGVFLQARVESLENTTGRTVFTVALREADGQPTPGPSSPDSLYIGASANWYAKHQYEFATEWLGELAQSQRSDAESERLRAQILSLSQWTMRQDADYWHGWLKRHDYKFAFLGDLAAGILDERLNSLAALLALAFLALMGFLARQTVRVPQPIPPVRKDKPPLRRTTAGRRGGRL